ncbi:MAG: hypothetical protein JWP81_1008, partial [Ferruginibacter sp.]|nr:hypothetical protein [Ferruginibacter sp.]
MPPEIVYSKRKEELATQLDVLAKKKSQLGWARFFAMAAILASGYFILSAGVLYLVPLVILLIIFIRLVYIDIENNNRIAHTRL